MRKYLCLYISQPMSISVCLSMGKYLLVVENGRYNAEENAFVNAVVWYYRRL